MTWCREAASPSRTGSSHRVRSTSGPPRWGTLTSVRCTNMLNNPIPWSWVMETEGRNAAMEADIATLQQHEVADDLDVAGLQAAIAALTAQVNGLAAIPLPSNTDPLALATTAAQGASTRYSRQDHAHPLPAWAVTTPARSLNSNFTPHATKWTLCLYTVSISATTTIGGGQDGSVELRSDAVATPTTVRAIARLRQVATLAVALQL